MPFIELISSPRTVSREQIKLELKDYARDLIATQSDEDVAGVLRRIGYCIEEWGEHKMTVSFCYEIVKPSEPKTFKAGTSSDIEAFNRTFGGKVSCKDIPTLRAMHLATHLDESLWSTIADVLEGFEGDTTLRVWTQS